MHEGEMYHHYHHIILFAVKIMLRQHICRL